jgi:alpha-beta hydrolase superfamily lysophospholipase
VDARGAVEDHLAARRALADEPGPLFLFGHSLGGLVTAASMARDPAGVRGVILSSPLLVAHASPFMRLVAALLGRLAPRSIVLRSDPKQLSRIPEAAEIVQADPMFCKPGGVPARLAASALATMADAWERYPGWTTPVLVFHGTADRVTDPAGSQRFVATIAARDKTLRLFAGAYHEILNDLDREDALRLVLEWLEARIDERT